MFCFVVWPKGSQHWSLRAMGGRSGWCQMAASRELMPMTVPSVSTTSVLVLTVSQSPHISPADLFRPAGLTHGPMKSLHFCPGSQCTHACVCPPRSGAAVSSPVVHSCTQAPLDYKAKCSGGSSPDARPPGWGA